MKNKKFRTMLRKSLLKHSKENEINKIINNNNINNSLFIFLLIT